MADPNKYKIFAMPQLQTVTPGAKVTYICNQTYSTYSASDSPRDHFKWYCYNDRESAKTYNNPIIVEGPEGVRWKDASWSFPGRHTLKCMVRFTDGAVIYYEYPQWVEGLEIFMAKELYKSKSLGFTDPHVTLTGVQRYISAIQDIARQFPITDPEQQRKHDKKIKEYEAYRDKLGERMASTQGCISFPLNAVHLETSTQTTSKLNVYLAQVERTATDQTWKLVDWTNPLDRAHTGEYSGSGATAEEAIRDAIDSWDSGNRYFDGVISWEVPGNVLGHPLQGRFETDGASRWDSVAQFFEWIALGAAVIAGVITLIAPVPGSQVVSAAIWTAIFSSTAAAAINIGQRHEEGFGSWSSDAFDGLTIVANVFAGAGMWARGSAVIARTAEGRIVKYILVGQITADSIQGVLIAEDYYGQYEAIMADKSLLPDERARKLLAFFANCSLAAAMTYINLKGTHADLENIGKKPKFVEANENTKPGRQKLDDLKDPNKTVDTTQAPSAEGHTGEGRQKTTVYEEQQRVHSEKKLKPIKFKRPPEPAKRGMLAKHHRGLANLAKEEKVIILVRDSNESATQWIGKEGYEPKPEKIKAKTARSGDNAGLAAANPDDPRLQKILAADGTTYPEYVKTMQDKGYSIGDPPDYLVMDSKYGTKYYSDYDLHGVYEDGTGASKGTLAFMDKINQSAFDGQEMVQHLPHDDWTQRNEEAAGPNRGPQPPVTAYLPDGSTVHLDTIGDMKQFYAQHGIDWNSKYPFDFNPDSYPSSP